MKIRFLFCAMLAFAGAQLYAQTTNTFPASGNVGIGTTMPTQVLQLEGATVAGGTNYIFMRKSDQGTGQGILIGQDVNDNNFIINLKANNDMRFITGGALNTEKMRITSGGNVGIGTTNPAQKLDVNGNIRVHGSLEGGAGSGAGTLTLYGDYTSLAGVTIQQNGNVGIGTTSPANLLTIKGNNHPNPEGIQLMASGYGGYTKLTTADAIDGAGSSFYQQFKLTIKDFQNAELDAFKIQMSTGVVQTTFPNGNVGIGTTSPGYKLDVIGTIHATEVIVDTSGADYVFKPNYNLMPLSQIEQAIKRDQHLPGIPSAQAMSSGGMNMGDLQTKLLAKIEELTLHQIEQEKHQMEQDKRIEHLEQENAELREKVNP